MRLKELVAADDFSKKMTRELGDKARSQRYALAAQQGWQRVIGEPKIKQGLDFESEKSKWLALLNSLESLPKTSNEEAQLVALKNYIKPIFGLQESVKLFSKNGPYQLRENNKDFLERIL